MHNDSAADWADQAEQRLLDAALALAPAHGWGGALAGAARQEGLSPAEAGLLLPGGAADLAALLSRRHDSAALAALGRTDPKSLRMRERIIRAVEARLEAAAADGQSARRCLAYLALPQHVGLGLRLAWETADALWRWAGDTATDENHYSKRAILAGILIAALPLRLQTGRQEAERFVHARVANVMSFEAWKAGLPRGDLAAKLAAALGRLRYGDGPRPG